MQPRHEPLNGLLEEAREIEELSFERWGQERTTTIVGTHPTLQAALRKAKRFAAAEAPVLLTGETGVGKDLFAQALLLGSRRRNRPFLAINCAQYSSDQIIASELFGHRKGSFTGATSDHRGIFEEASGGVVFLDEIGELPLGTQAMLLRTLSSGEVVPVGGTRAKRVDVRIVAATNRNLGRMVKAGNFREDLYFRLRCLPIRIPPLRERGEDWEAIASYYLQSLGSQYQKAKILTEETRRHLSGYPWPGNVREVRNLIDVGFHLAESDEITLEDLGEVLEETTRRDQLRRIPLENPGLFCERMASGDETFWSVMHRPYLERELNRSEVTAVLSHALRNYSGGSYKRMLLMFGVAEEDYLKAMDFLRHHRLKPALPS